MRYGIISDIHGNLEALTAVLRDCQKNHVKAYLCIGDIVGYGANPKECLNAVKKIKAVTVAGNHDWAASGRLDASYFTDDGKAAILWTRSKITLGDIEWLNQLELVYEGKGFHLVHGSLNRPGRFEYLTGNDRAEETFKLMKQPICFVGHTHKPVIYAYQRGNVYELPDVEAEINANGRYIVNIGSVGQPRDGVPMASYCLYDTDQNMVEIKRVHYDIKGAQTKILAVGLPPRLAQRLEGGQ